MSVPNRAYFISSVHMKIRLCKRGQIGLFIAIVPGKTFLVFPAPDRFIQRSALVIRKKITNIRIAFRAFVRSGFRCLFPNLHSAICRKRVFIRFARVVFQPLQKFRIELKRIPQMRQKKYPVSFGTNKVILDDCTQVHFLRTGFRISFIAAFAADISGIEIIYDAIRQFRFRAVRAQPYLFAEIR